MGQRQAYGLGRDSTRHLRRISCQQHSDQTRCSSSQSKTDKYTKLASTHIFCPFAIETAGAWHETAIEVTQEIGRRITVVTEDTRETEFLFQRLSIPGGMRSPSRTLITLYHITLELFEWHK